MSLTYIEYPSYKNDIKKVYKQFKKCCIFGLNYIKIRYKIIIMSESSKDISKEVSFLFGGGV